MRWLIACWLAASGCALTGDCIDATEDFILVREPPPAALIDAVRACEAGTCLDLCEALVDGKVVDCHVEHRGDGHHVDVTYETGTGAFGCP